MSNRYQLLDTDEERLPEGVERVGYDADTETYTYQDRQGNYFEGEPGNRYGQLHRTGTRGPTQRNTFATPSKLAAHKTEDWRYFAPFFLLVVVFLLGVWHFFGPGFVPFRCNDGLQPYRIVKGDTCWDIAESRGTTVDELTKINKGLSCDALKPGVQICVPLAGAARGS